MRVGIDLGTTYSAVAKIDENTGKAVVLRNSFGLPTTPSVLYFQEDGKIIHGQEAKDYYEDGDPEAEAYFKYRMGDAAFEAEHCGKSYQAEDLAAELLKGLVAEAEAAAGEKIDEAVITVPAYFDDQRRKATIRAGEKAGLKVLGLINEPTAAVFAYGINGKDMDKTIMIYDLGGGTFDITIAKVTENDITVLGADGDHELGGRDWDHAIVDYIADRFYDEFDIMTNEDYNFNNSLRVLAEKAKKALASKNSEKLTVNYMGRRGTYTLTQEKFAEITEHLVERTENIIDKLFDELSMNWGDIDGVILVGGSTRMKMVQDFVLRMSGKPAYSGVDQDLAVALGAAIRANIDADGNPVQKRALRIGGRQNAPKFMIAGAKAFHEATSHSLGMITESTDRERYINNIMIRKNSPIPATYTETYELRVGRKEEDNHLDVYMLQGESEELYWPLNAECLGKYVFTGIQNRGQKTESVAVTYRYTEDAVVEVSAVQNSTGKSLQLTIDRSEEDLSWVEISPKERAQEGSAGPMSIAMAIDLSGSMSGALDEVRQAARDFIAQFDMNQTQVGIIGFATRQDTLCSMTNSVSELHRTLDRMDCGDGLGYGTSAIPFALAGQMLAKREGIRYVLVLTDGEWFGESEAIQEAHKLINGDIDIIAIGFADANESFLRQIASRQDLAALTDLSGLSDVFTGIARKL